MQNRTLQISFAPPSLDRVLLLEPSITRMTKLRVDASLLQPTFFWYDEEEDSSVSFNAVFFFFRVLRLEEEFLQQREEILLP